MIIAERPRFALAMYRLDPDARQCGNCRAWEFQYPESDGRSVGRCRRLSGTDWRYDYIPLVSDAKFELHTRCDFGCVLFSRKPPTKGRIEPDIQDEP